MDSRTYHERNIVPIQETDLKVILLETINKEIISGENYFDLKIPRSVKSGTNYKLTLVTEGKKAIQLNFSIKK